MWTKTIRLREPYEIDHVLYRLALDPLNVIDQKQQIIKVPLVIQGEKTIVTIQQIGTKEAPVFQIAAENGHDKIVERVAKIFGWNTSFQQITRHFQETPLEPLFQEFQHTPLVCEYHYFDCLIRSIIHQQVNLTFARRLTERFVKTYGEKIDDVWFYPSPAMVANLTVEELRELQFSGRKAEYVIGLGKVIANGDLHLEQLADLSNEEVEKALLPLRGVGRWTVENFLLFGLGRKDVFPVADIGIQNAIKKIYTLETKPDREMLETLRALCSPYGSYASLYLWKSLEKET